MSQSVSCPALEIELVQTSQFLINDLNQSWFPTGYKPSHTKCAPHPSFHCSHSGDSVCGCRSHVVFCRAKLPRKPQFYKNRNSVSDSKFAPNCVLCWPRGPSQHFKVTIIEGHGLNRREGMYSKNMDRKKSTYLIFYTACYYEPIIKPSY